MFLRCFVALCLVLSLSAVGCSGGDSSSPTPETTTGNNEDPSPGDDTPTDPPIILPPGGDTPTDPETPVDPPIVLPPGEDPGGPGEEPSTAPVLEGEHFLASLAQWSSGEAQALIADATFQAGGEYQLEVLGGTTTVSEYYVSGTGTYVDGEELPGTGLLNRAYFFLSPSGEFMVFRGHTIDSKDSANPIQMDEIGLSVRMVPQSAPDGVFHYILLENSPWISDFGRLEISGTGAGLFPFAPGTGFSSESTDASLSHISPFPAPAAGLMVLEEQGRKWTGGFGASGNVLCASNVSDTNKQGLLVAIRSGSGHTQADLNGWYIQLEYGADPELATAITALHFDGNGGITYRGEVGSYELDERGELTINLADGEILYGALDPSGEFFAAATLDDPFRTKMVMAVKAIY